MVHDYLFHVNQELCRLKEEHSKLDILEVCFRWPFLTGHNRLTLSHYNYEVQDVVGG